MDLLGDIVERATAPATAPAAPIAPTASAPARPSRWRQRLQAKGLTSMSGVVNGTADAKTTTPPSDLTPEEQMHQENIERLARMTPADRAAAKEELIDSMDPKVLQMLLNRSARKYGEPTTNATSTPTPIEGSLGTWVGGEHALDKGAHVHAQPTQKKTRFSSESQVIYLDEEPGSASDDGWEDVQDVEDVHDSTPAIHFPKPTQPYEELDINDPLFNDKLHEKYFPDLPKNPQQLEWMAPLPTTPKNIDIEYDSIDSVRFDFKGDIISNENIEKYTGGENQGLHNHSDDPHLPGYTLQELAHYLRSTFPGQVCIAARTLGRIIYKLGTLKYQIQEQDANTNANANLNPTGNEGLFEIECWKLLARLQVLDLLQNYASDKEKNLSVKSYSIDALWLCQKCNAKAKLKQFAATT